MIQIAGRRVAIGDRLYHKGLGVWCRAMRHDPSGSLEVQVQNALGGRVFLITNGGMHNGQRQMYWHEPLNLDMPFDDVSKYQELLDVLAERF